MTTKEHLGRSASKELTKSMSKKRMSGDLGNKENTKASLLHDDDPPGREGLDKKRTTKQLQRQKSDFDKSNTSRSSTATSSARLMESSGSRTSGSDELEAHGGSLEGSLRRPGSSDLLGESPVETRERWCKQKIINAASSLCDSYRFHFLTTILTLYALFGDDFRLAATHKGTDGIFNIITLVCILVFVVEVLAASIGRAGYFLGFFFALDTVSTVTLVLDLSWVGDVLMCGGTVGSSDEDDARDEAVKTGRAGRAGARASRTVRIIRLLRLVKLYKAYKAAMEQRALEQKQQRAEELKKERARRLKDGVDPGDDSDSDDIESEQEEEKKEVDAVESGASAAPKDKEIQEEEQDGNETRVGKKLSEMTTRRVIVLVLVMLFLLPQFSLDSTQVSFNGFSMQDFQTSAHLGMSIIYERWRSWCPVNVSSPSSLPDCLRADSATNFSSPEMQELRAWYENYLATFIYTHHEGAGIERTLTKLCWIGVNSRTLVDANGRSYTASFLSKLAQLGQAKYLGASVVPLSSWDDEYMNVGWSQVGFSPIPQQVKEDLTSPWKENCRNYYGVPVTSFSKLRENSCSLDRDLRCQEVEFVSPELKTKDEDGFFSMIFAFDLRGFVRLEARLSMLQTIFICCAVGLGSMLFSSDADHLLLVPIQRMIAKMETIKDNPLEAMKLGDLEYRREEVEKIKMKEELANKSRFKRLLSVFERKANHPTETIILEKTIIKLGIFLAVSFGEAGAEIVGRHLKGNHMVELSALAPGQVENAILCFCGIRHFPELLEALGVRVTLFVNHIAEIVHAVVDEYNGVASKNYGDSFLLVWCSSHQPADMLRRIADNAVLAMIKIISFIAKSVPLTEYSTHPILIARVPNFFPEVCLGMHCGTVAACAVGSEYKLDPLYLSQNVKIASLLQSASSHYRVNIIFSHLIMSAIGHETALLCRLIDHVTIPGSRQPLRIFTIDLDLNGARTGEGFAGKLHIRNRFKLRQLRELHRNENWNEDIAWQEPDILDELDLMRELFTDEFFLRFSTAYRNYEAGAWFAARDLLVTCHYNPTRFADSFVGIDEDDWPVDGPTVALLSFMKQTNFKAPSNWMGHRRLVREPGS